MDNKIFKIVLFIWISAVIIAGLLVPIPHIPALGDRARVLYFHVPTAWVTVLAFLVSMWFSIRYLKTKDLLNDHKASAAAGLGLMFCILATVTGSVWAKFNWGSFWNWDPRETSIFMLLLIYGAYFALRNALESEEQKAKLSSVYSILAFITVPFFIFILPRIVESLHPDPIINDEGKIHMDTAMLIIFLSSLAGFTALFFWLYSLRVRVAKLDIQTESNV
jgi:heme exporter protein C